MGEINQHTIDSIPFQLKNSYLHDEPIMKDPDDPPVLGDTEKQLGCMVAAIIISSFLLFSFFMTAVLSRIIH